MKKVLCFVEARMGSVRFPGKVLKKVNKNFTVIDYVLKNILSSKYFDKSEVYLLTSTNKENNRLVEFVKNSYDIQIYRGSEKNVYQRIYKFVKKKRNNIFLRLTGDNPLVDPILIDKFVKFFLKGNYDYLSSRSMDKAKKWNEKSDFPEGLSLEIFRKKIFLSFKKKVNRINMEFPTWHFFNNPNKIKRIKVKKFPIFLPYKKISKKMRVTIDIKKDLVFIRKIANKFNFKPGRNNIANFLKGSLINERKNVYVNFYKKN